MCWGWCCAPASGGIGSDHGSQSKIEKAAGRREGACGPLPPFVGLRSHPPSPSEPRLPGGRLRSCPPSWAAPSSPPLLRSAGHPTSLARHYGGTPPVANLSVPGSGRWGAWRSEVKEEERAQPVPGDMSGATHPDDPIPHRGLDASARGPSRTSAMGRKSPLVPAMSSLTVDRESALPVNGTTGARRARRRGRRPSSLPGTAAGSRSPRHRTSSASSACGRRSASAPL